MGFIKDQGGDVYRDFVTTGVPASGPNEPAKSDIRALFSAVDLAIGAAQAGLAIVGTVAERDTFYATEANRGKLVYVNNNNGSATDPANGVYEHVAGAPRIAQSFYQSLASVVQPLVELAEAYANADTDTDIPGADAGDRGAKFWAGKAADAVAPVNAVIQPILQGGTVEDPRKFRARSGWDNFTRTSDGYLIDGVRSFDNPPAFDPSAPAVPKLKLAMIGHSFVAEGLGAVIAAKVSQLLGKTFPAANLGHSGIASESIVQMVNVAAQTYRPVSGVIPDDTSEVRLTPDLVGPCSAFGGGDFSVYGILHSVLGKFNWHGAGVSQMYFQRLNAGEPVYVPYPVPFVSPMFDYLSEAAYISAGTSALKTVADADVSVAGLILFRNSAQNPTLNVTQFLRKAVAETKQVVSILRPREKAWFMLPDLQFTSGEDTLTAAKLNAWRVEAARRWPRNYIDIPESITRRDGLHPSVGGLGSGSGQEQIANIVAPALIARGLVNTEWFA